MWLVVSLMMRPRKRVFGFALFDGLIIRTRLISGVSVSRRGGTRLLH